MENEVIVVNVEDLLSAAIVDADEKVQEAAPGSEERERLAHERDLLFKVWLEVNKQSSEIVEKEELKKDSKFKKILEAIRTGADVVVKGLQVGGSLALAIGVVSLGHKEGFMSADDARGLSMFERLLTR